MAVKAQKQCANISCVHTIYFKLSLVMICGKRDVYSMLLVMQTVTTTVEINMEVPQEAEN